MPSTAFDLGYLEAAVDLLEGYLLTKDVYWKINASSPTGEPPYPSLTLGGLLLAQCRLRARQKTQKLEDHYSRLHNEINRIRSKWRIAWENKAKGDFRLRLNLWRDFLEEFRTDPGANIDRYSYEINRRVMLHLLSGEIREIPHSEQQMLAGLDGILTGLLVPGDFIWEADLSSGFPVDDYPYLYGTLRH